MDDLFEELRPKGFAIAYRMLGSVSEAEDVVQEAFVRPAEDEDPARHAEIADSLSVGLLTVLETLSPEERAVFLLREVFDYPHERIAAVLDKSPAAVRQLAVRARRRVSAREPRFETSREQRERLAASFFDAFEDGDLEGLEGVLAADVSLHGDGGGKVPALGRALHGRSRVARTMLGFRRAGKRFGGVTIRRAEVNGEPGALSFGPEGKLLSVLSLEIAEGQVRAVRSVVNPDKLAHLGPVGDFKALLAGSKRDRHS